MNDYNDRCQITYFIHELLILVSEGKTEPIDVIVQEADKSTLAEYIKQKYGFKSINISQNCTEIVQTVLDDIYIDTNEAKKSCLENNGLVYLIKILMDRLETDYFSLLHS